jgi:hypothetical protein
MDQIAYAVHKETQSPENNQDDCYDIEYVVHGINFNGKIKIDARKLSRVSQITESLKDNLVTPYTKYGV